MSASTPNPGSPEAGNLGCLCAVIDNHYGKGFPWGGAEACFWISGDCPLHGKESGENTSDGVSA